MLQYSSALFYVIDRHSLKERGKERSRYVVRHVAALLSLLALSGQRGLNIQKFRSHRWENGPTEALISCS